MLNDSFKENVTGLKILTPNGLEDFKGVQKITKDWYYHLLFNDGTEIKCSENHPFIQQNGIKVKAKHLSHHHLLKSQHGSKFLIRKELKKESIELYDIIDSGYDHVYYTNGLLSHNCAFHGSTSSLLSGDFLSSLTAIPPLKIEQEFFKIYSLPEPEKIYVATIDTSEGIGKDYSVINIIDISEYPYKQVAIYRNNNIISDFFAEICYRIMKRYNNAFALIETNNPDGKKVAELLYYDYGYEEMLNSIIDKGDNEISSTAKSDIGVRQTKKTKRIGCSNLKTLLENGSIIVYDEETIKELNYFNKRGNSYQADKGKNDDIVMTLVLFAWFVNQTYFEELTDINVRQMIRKKYIEEYEESLAIFGFYDDGTRQYEETDYYGELQYPSK